MIIQSEVVQNERIAEMNRQLDHPHENYGFPCTRILAYRYRDHPDSS